MKILSNDKLSTGLSDRLYSSYIVLLLNPSRDHILSLALKENADSSFDISIMLPSVLKFGLITNG